MWGSRRLMIPFSLFIIVIGIIIGIIIIIIIII
jgi:hypothetical protein